MTQTLIKLGNNKIRAMDLTGKYLDDDLMPFSETIRIYKSSPESITLQIRSFNNITPKGKPRHIVSTAQYLGLDEIDEIITTLQALKNEIT